MDKSEQKYLKGVVSAASPSVLDLLAHDSKPLGAGLSSVGTYEPKLRGVDMRRYHDPAFAALENEKLWSRTWQMVCREEELPEVGDRLAYDVGTLSLIVARSGPARFSAFDNSCRHRGTRLVDGMGGGQDIRCPFHGWRWNLDGSFHSMPGRWDFPGAENKDLGLPTVQVGTWGGFVFINPDPQAGPLEDALGVLKEHFRLWDPAKSFVHAHVRKKIRANWKTVAEAFLEAYHVIETHSDSMPFVGDANTQYDIWDDGVSHISRLITPTGVPSPHLGDDASGMAALQGAAAMFSMAAGPSVGPPHLDSIEQGRAQIAQWRRDMMGTALGRDFSALPDAAMLDSVQYFMFPNFCPWWGEGLPLAYQFLPLGVDPNESMMVIRLLAPLPGGDAPRLAAAQPVELDFDELLTGRVNNIGLLSHIFDQDMMNLPRVQQGMRTAKPDSLHTRLGRYQESRIAHFQEVLNRTLGIDGCQKLSPEVK